MDLHQVILDNLEEVVHVVDRDMEVLFINQAVEKLSRGKLKREEVVGKNLYQVFPFLKETGVDEEYRKVFSTGQPLRTEEWTEYYGESIYTVTTKIPVPETGEADRVITILRDLTDLKKTEESLREVADTYTTMLDLAQEGICIDDQEEQMTFVNDAFAAMLGYENKEDLLGKTIFDFVDEEGREILESEINSRRRDKPSRYELKVYTKQGQPKYLLVSATPLIIDGEYQGSISVNLDLTERKKAEEKMRQALEEERVFKLKTAHHFFNPIAISKGYMDIALESLPRQEAEEIEKARKAIMRVENVIENIVQRGEIHE